MNPSSAIPQDFRRDLEARVRGGVTFDEVTRGIYATDASNYQIVPIAVVTPKDAADVKAAVACAYEHGVPVLPRGGGTSLSGQTAGAGLVLDFSKWMNRILELNVRERWVRVEPGLVRDELNAAIAEHGLYFAPDPATANRCAVGGMIGNNSSGTRSIVYGKTIDHVIGLKVLLAEGEELDLGADGTGSPRGRRTEEILLGIRRIVDENRDEIEARYPKVMRRVGGYPLDELLDPESWNPAKLLVGSEGTLAVTLEARLELEPIPPHTSLCVAHFQDVIEALRAVVPILEHGPTAVEILDRSVISLARENATISRICDFLEGEPEAVLIIEFFGESGDDVREKAERVAADMKELKLGFAWPLRLGQEEQARVWEVRKHGLGIMLSMKGDKKPIPLIEDACVPVEVLPEYIEKVIGVIRGSGADFALYAHASVGVIHIRPILDLRRTEDIERMVKISEQTFELVREYGGAWSGEHGDGLLRSTYMERFYGPRIYQAFREVKRLFDPKGLMNPGKIIEAPPIDRDLRYGPSYRSPAFPTLYHYRAEESFAAAVEMCTGVGACRKTMNGVMCPSYMATRDEEHSTRGRANALRLAMTGQLGPSGMTGNRLYQVLDLCLGCKACKSECPSEVDMAKLKSEFLQRYMDAHGGRPRDRLIARAPRWASRLSGALATLVNAIQASELFRRTVQSELGFHFKRTLPSYASETFPSWFERRHPGGPSSSVEASVRARSEGRSRRDGSGAEDRRVVLFDDTYMNHHQPRIGRAAVELLESCGYDVFLAGAGCCQRPRLSRGFLREAAREGERTLRILDSYIKEGIPIVVCEPSCASALVDDLPDLMEDEALAGRISENVSMIDVFIAREIEAGRIERPLRAGVGRALVHGHCHQKALFGTSSMMGVYAGVGGLEALELDAGCCGMAGSFGYEKDHYELSVEIAEDRFLPALRELGPGTAFVACGFSCRHQALDLAGVEALHWVETVRGSPPEEKL